MNCSVDPNKESFSLEEADFYCQKLIKKLHKLNISSPFTVDLVLIREAIDYAKYYHSGQKRDSGEPFISHPLTVAYMVSEYCFKTEVIIAAILHDVVEDTFCTLENIKDKFGSYVAKIVEGLTNNKLNHKISTQEITGILLKNGNYEALLIKLLDRLHNMRTIKIKSKEKQCKIARETLSILFPIAIQLDKLKIAKEFYKLCFQVLSI